MTITKKRRWGALAAVGVLAIAFAWLIYGGLDSNVVYFLTPKELEAKGEKGYDVPVRLGGQVKPGSVKWDDKTLSLQFRVTDGAGEIAVHSKGAPPQMFRDGMGVVVEGRYGRGRSIRRDRPDGEALERVSRAETGRSRRRCTRPSSRDPARDGTAGARRDPRLARRSPRSGDRHVPVAVRRGRR